MLEPVAAAAALASPLMSEAQQMQSVADLWMPKTGIRSLFQMPNVQQAYSSRKGTVVYWRCTWRPSLALWQGGCNS